ncbi:MAG: hypothetical protein RIQ71_353 [Verrucomicrobiota bacterium]|jgi:hypothetical protein
MSVSRTGDKRYALIRVLIWGGILAALVFFWISVGVALFAWIS